MNHRDFERLLSALLDADRESELLGAAPGCSPAEAEQARRKWLDALGALMNEVSTLAAERGKGGERERAIEECAHAVEYLAARTSREDEEQRAWLEAWGRAAETIRHLASPRCACGAGASIPARTQRTHTREKCWDVNVDTREVTFLAPASPAPPRADEKCAACGNYEVHPLHVGTYGVAGRHAFRAASPAPRAPGDET